jgi:hypothetical protein
MSSQPVYINVNFNIILLFTTLVSQVASSRNAIQPILNAQCFLFPDELTTQSRGILEKLIVTQLV